MQDDQFARIIEEAEEHVACVGYREADLKDIFLLGIGYLSRNQRRPGPSKKVIVGTLSGGTAGLTALVELVKSVFVGG